MHDVAIIGMGYVGSAMWRYFSTKYDTVWYDSSTPKGEYDASFYLKGLNSNELNDIDLAVICVPTPMKEDNRCNTGIVETVINKIDAKLFLIKSTIPPGTVDQLVKATGKNIVFSPEYCGEPDYNPGHNFQSTVANEPFYIFGGDKKDTARVVEFFSRISGPTKTYMQCTAKEAEMIKYMENTFLGNKVIFTYEMYQACQALGIDFHTVREGWLLDPRINKSHTAVFKDNKYPFGGKCLPKDINAIVQTLKDAGYDPDFFEEILKTNNRLGKLRDS